MQNLLVFRRLNPCSNGILKYFLMYRHREPEQIVLILVLMEYKNT